jgi:hypothetical protein
MIEKIYNQIKNYTFYDIFQILSEYKIFDVEIDEKFKNIVLHLNVDKSAIRIENNHTSIVLISSICDTEICVCTDLGSSYPKSRKLLSKICRYNIKNLL